MHDNDSISWPDPDPVINADTKCTKINDVSRMSDFPDGTPVSRILFPRCEEDVKGILQAAHKSKKRIGIRGTKHSMGGHSVASQIGWEIDTKFLRHMIYDPKEDPNIVRCGPGCTWADLIKLLNPFGKSPRTMQSYCSFSVGGTLAVNAHGITTDFCLAESVLEIRLARVTKTGNVQVIECRPSSEEKRKSSLGNELFALAIGGYGLFGVITEVVLKVQDNVHLELDSMQLPISIDSSKFVRIYDNCRGCGGTVVTDDHENQEDDGFSLGKVEMKLARLNTVNLEKVSLYVFKKSSPSSTVSELPSKPRELSVASRLLYKWALPQLKGIRYSQEESSGKAVDWSQDEALTRNQLLFESAMPLAKLYSPILKRDDTFVLQEFFCPHHRLSEWIEAVKPIFKEIEDQQHKHSQDLILLNTTIRFVEKDDSTFLSYSRQNNGCFAFVLYYRIKRVEEVEKRLGEFHNRLAQITCDLGGTFYLPYRKCYSMKLLKASYPMIEEFAELKEKFDPSGLFGNLWFEEYVLPLTSNGYRTKWHSTANSQEHALDGDFPSHRGLKIVENNDQFKQMIPRSNSPHLIRRSNSYRTLLRSKKLRDEFRQQFLVQIFNLADPDEVMRVMTRAAWDPANNDDIDIYKQLYFHFHGSQTKLVGAQIPQYWRGIQQLRHQKEELTRQTISMLSKLGKAHSIRSYCCIGDHGKTVNSFVEALGITGSLWVVHSSDDINEKHEQAEVTQKMPSLATVLERGSLDPVAHEEILYDYMAELANEKMKIIPSGTVDLVTMNQGLHHIPIEKLFGFLNEVKRIMGPNGTFIIREHDLRIDAVTGKVPYAMLDLAHSVFNAVTGVEIRNERKEVRAFRPVMEWREILELVGFVDAMVYEVENEDPTWDEMMAFSKVSSHDASIIKSCEIHTMPCLSLDSQFPPVARIIRTLLGQIPTFILSNTCDILEFFRQQLPQLQECFRKAVEDLPTLLNEFEMSTSHARLIGKKVTDMFEHGLQSSFEQMIAAIDGVLSMLTQSDVQELYNFKNLGNIPELTLILPYLERKVEREGESCNDMEKMVIQFIRKNFPALLPDTADTEVKASSPTSCQSFDTEFSKTVEKNSRSVTGEEIQQFIESLQEHIPGILDPDIVVAQSGFTLPQQASLLGKFGGKTLPFACDNLASYLNRQIWTEMMQDLNTVKATGDLPTKSRLLSSSDEHPWHCVLQTLLKSPKVNLNQQGFFGLKLIGLGDICILYEKAKKEQDDLETTHTLDCDLEVTSCLATTNKSLEDLSRDWTDDVVQRVITYDGSEVNCLVDVAEVLEANFGYKSITSRKVDITVGLRLMHDQIHTKILKELSTTTSTKRDKLQIGFLPINEQLLVEIRNKGNSKKEIGDSLRRNFVIAATLGNAGKNQLNITYRRFLHGDIRSNASVQSSLSSGHIDNMKPVVNSILDMLEAKGIVRSDLHPSDGHYTWFKLNEWMQVEILDELVKSLEHSPWYRFPFTSFLRTYFNVFQQQCKIVQRKYGPLAAYGSEAFFVDLIPGVVMSALFSQLQLLAIPLKMTMPADGYDGHDQTRFCEEIIIHARLQKLETTFDFQEAIDQRILKVTLLPNNFIVLTTPPFKAMGEILKRFAIRIPTARVLQISNQTEVQVRISGNVGVNHDKNSDKELGRIQSLGGIKYAMDYRYPNASGTANLPTDTLESRNGTAFYCFHVECLALLDLFRLCESTPNFRVEQVYDFWN